MKFAAWVFRLAGMYGVISMLPLYFLEHKINTDFPPPMTHPEHFYAFIGVTLVWQILFFVIAANPSRYHVFMLLALLEKMTFIPAFLILFPQGRFPRHLFPPMIVDLTLGVLFLISYFKVKSIAAGDVPET